MKLLYLLAAALGLPLAAQVKITQAADRITIDIDDKPFTAFYAGADTAKPYLHPLRTASGKTITRFYPMEKVEGEVYDHVHHRGLWFTHGKVNEFDFWANEKSQKGATSKKGLIVTKKIGKIESGEKSGRILGLFEWQDDQGGALLTEARTMTFSAPAGQRMIDFDITLTAAAKVTFGDTKEGTFALRLRKELEERQGGRMTNAEGASTEKNVWGKRSPWVDYCGELQGEKICVAIMDHPSNPRHPTYWHSRAYGLFATNIFGVQDFERDKSKDGSLTLEPGQSLQFRYRVLIHPGDTATADIPSEFNKFAKSR